MISLIMWWAGICLESVIILRAFRSKMFSVYPRFYAYVVCVLATEISRFAVYKYKPEAYAQWWWGTEFLSLLMGYFVIFDIFEKALAGYEGVRRLARVVGLVVLAGIVGFTSFQLLAQSHLAQGLTSIEVERNLRCAELILLGGILLVTAYYDIPMGRNLKGIVLGYGLYVATVVIGDGVWSYLGESSRAVVSTVRGDSYLAALMVWTVALWSYQPNPVPNKSALLDEDYQAIVTKTKNAIREVRSHFHKGGRA